VSFLVCAPCQLAWLPEKDLEAQGARLHPHRSVSSQRCPSCGGEQQDRTVILEPGLLPASHCPACRQLTLPLAKLLEFARPRAARPAPALAGSPEAQAVTIDERDRVFAFLLALPLELSEQRDTVPVGIAALVAACSAAFVLDVSSDGVFGAPLIFSTAHGALHRLIGLLTSVFVHMDALHLLGNMYFLFAFGRLLERRLGTGITLTLFATSGVVSSLAFWAAHFDAEEASLAGASGAISGLLGCYLALFPGRRVGVSLLFWVIRVPAVLYLGWWLVVQLVSMPEERGIAYSAHAGGFLAGLVWGLAIRRTREDLRP
jgi:membrane associated rhomboid family serine protease